MKNKYKMITLIICASLLMSCSINQETESPYEANGSSTNENIELDIKTMSESIVEYEDNDFYTEWENDNPNYINLNGTSAEIQGSGAIINDSIITINLPGTYVLQGNLENGQVIVESGSKDAVRLVLNNVEINCLDNAPIYVKSAGKVIISLPDNTKNTVSDGSTYNLADVTSDEPNAAIYCKDDLTINGTGTLIVNANYNNGIAGKDDLKITNGNIIINSVDDGLLGRDLLAIKDCNITINSQGDSIKATNDSDAGSGNILLENGIYTLNSGSDGIQAESTITIVGGEYTINSTDDSIHSNNTINIYGGKFSITSEDDGIHGDSTINITNGTIDILKSYEGIESAVINISGGTINIKASDDGINIAAKNDNLDVGKSPGQDTSTNSENYNLNISGGTIYIDSLGDGIDANGSVYMSGGTVIVNGPTSNGNSSLDYDKKFEITGGLLIAAGSAGMPQTLSDSSSQNSVLIHYSQLQSAGTLINISDEKGNSIITYAPSKDYQTLIVSSPNFNLNSTYTLFKGGTSSDGTKLTDFTVSKNIMSLKDTGEEVTGGTFMPGQGGFGGKGNSIKPDRNMTDGEKPQIREKEIPQTPEQAPDNF